MKKFIAKLNDNEFINIQADEMKLEGGAITVFINGKLIAFLNASVVQTAHISEKVVTS